VLIVIGAMLVSGAIVVLGMAAGPTRRVGVGRAVAGGGAAHAGPDAPADAGRTWPEWMPRAACGLAGAALWALIGGVPGLLAGAFVALAGPAVLGRFETGARRRRRLALIAGAPLVADLLAASLAAGATVERSVPVIARALGGPVCEVLEQVAARIRLGEPAEQAWARVADTPGLGAIALTVARASRSGAPLAGLLANTADDLRADAAAAALAEVRATSVRAVLPLGLCLLPAFGLLGILPVVAGLIPAL